VNSDGTIAVEEIDTFVVVGIYKGLFFVSAAREESRVVKMESSFESVLVEQFDKTVVLVSSVVKCECDGPLCAVFPKSRFDPFHIVPFVFPPCRQKLPFFV
jgi:hypothetical protein